MLHQPRYSTAIQRATLVLFLVLLSTTLVAADNHVPGAAGVTATTAGPSTLVTVAGTTPSDQQPANPPQKVAPSPTPAPRQSVGMGPGTGQQSEQALRRIRSLASRLT
jgi:hypothetical protein